MSKNTGKKSEKDFESRLTSQGKAAYFYRIKDAASIKGLTGRVGHVDKTPSDYIVVMDGITEFAEVKSTQDPTAFRFSLLKSGQTGHGARILAAGGCYSIYVHNLNDDAWFKVPLFRVNEIRATDKQSISWVKMTEFSWC